MDKIDMADNACRITNKKNTGQLRWRNGILEQRWAIEEISPHLGVSYKWEPIPVYKDGDE